MAKIKDVARLAGVSSATVSRAMQNDPRVTEETRSKVRDAAQRLGYRPNRIARSLRTRRTDLIGLIVSDIENPHFTRAVRAIEDAAFAAGFRVMLCNTDETLEKQHAYLEVLVAEMARGIILVTSDANDPKVSDVVEMGIPIVAFDRVVNANPVDAILPDNVGAIREAVQHLRDRDCDTIAMIRGRMRIQSGQERYEAYVQAMKDAGQNPISVDGAFRERHAEQAVKDLLRDHPDVDGLLVSNNMMTVGALKGLKAMGVIPGKDIKVIGFDDPTWMSLIDPSVTAIAQPTVEMASAAFRRLLARIEGDEAPARRIVFPCELVPRESA